MSIGSFLVSNKPIILLLLPDPNQEQRKRVNIGLELMAQPEILFLDEPTSGCKSLLNVFAIMSKL